MDKRLGSLRAGILIGLAVAVGIAGAAVAIWKIDWTGRKGSGLGEEFTYDIERYRKIDPELILYKQAAAIATGFQEARGIAVGPGDRVYVAGDKAIRIFGKDAAPLSRIALPGEPRTLAVAADGTLYVCMKDHVEVHDAAGEPKASWEALGKDAVLTSVAASKGEVFVADAGNRVVYRYDTAGKLLGRIGQADEARNIPGFAVPSPYFDLAVGSEGLLWVVDPGRRRVEAYTFQGERELSWGRSAPSIEGFSGCCNPVNFALLADGKFVTCEKGLTRVKVYDAEGRFECVVAGPEQLDRQDELCPGGDATGCRSGGLDVAADSEGRILVLDPLSREVRVFTRLKKE